MIDKPFAYHKPSEDGLKRITRLRDEFSALKRTIEEVAPVSRQQSVALTELETAAMWAIKAVVFNDPAEQETKHDEEAAVNLDAIRAALKEMREAWGVSYYVRELADRIEAAITGADLDDIAARRDPEREP